jgi:hypothetical protein
MPPAPAILPAHAARHEAAHAVLAWLVCVPFHAVRLGAVPGTNQLGGVEADPAAIRLAVSKAAGRAAVSTALFARLAAMVHVAELADVRINGLPAEVTALRAGAPAPGRAIDGDYRALNETLDFYGVPVGPRPMLEQVAKGYACQLLDLEWFRNGVIAVGDRLLAQPRLLDVEVAETLAASLPPGSRLPALPEPAEEEVRAEADALGRHGDRGHDHDLRHWYSARKGLRFLRAAGG